MASKVYDSKNWLLLQHYQRGKSVDEIAALAKVAPMTIRRKMQQHGIKIVK